MKKLILIVAALGLPQLALSEGKDCSRFEQHVKFYTEKLDGARGAEEQARLQQELEAARKRLDECTNGKRFFNILG